MLLYWWSVGQQTLWAPMTVCSRSDGLCLLRSTQRPPCPWRKGSCSGTASPGSGAATRSTCCAPRPTRCDCVNQPCNSHYCRVVVEVVASFAVHCTPRNRPAGIAGHQLRVLRRLQAAAARRRRGAWQVQELCCGSPRRWVHDNVNMTMLHDSSVSRAGLLCLLCSRTDHVYHADGRLQTVLFPLRLQV